MQIKGLKELNAELQRAENSVDVPALKRLLFESVDIIRQEAVVILRSHTRRSAKLREGWQHIEDALLSRAGKSNMYASAYAKLVNRLAPHGKWLEFGHRIVGHRPKKTDLGKVVSAHPFFRPAVDAKRTEVRRNINDGIKALLEGRSPFGSNVGSEGRYTDSGGGFIN